MDNIIPIGPCEDIQIAIIQYLVHNQNHAIEQMFGSVGKRMGRVSSAKIGRTPKHCPYRKG